MPCRAALDVIFLVGAADRRRQIHRRPAFPELTSLLREFLVSPSFPCPSPRRLLRPLVVVTTSAGARRRRHEARRR